MKPYLKNKQTNKQTKDRAYGVAQDVGLEFKPQHGKIK
jgi:hypothetical protein